MLEDTDHEVACLGRELVGVIAIKFALDELPGLSHSSGSRAIIRELDATPMAFEHAPALAVDVLLVP